MLTRNAHTVLTYLAGTPEQTAKEVAAITGLQQVTAAATLQSLERKGHTRRVFRGVWSITDEGRAAIGATE